MRSPFQTVKLPMSVAFLSLIMANGPAHAQDDAALQAALAACTQPGATVAERVESLAITGWESVTDGVLARERMQLFGMTRFPQPLLEGGNQFVDRIVAAREMPLPNTLPGGVAPEMLASDVAAQSGFIAALDLENPAFDGQLMLQARPIGDDGNALLQCQLIAGIALDVGVIDQLALAGATVSRATQPSEISPITTMREVKLEGSGDGPTVQRLTHIDVGAATGLTAIRKAAGTTAGFETVLLTALSGVAPGAQP